MQVLVGPGCHISKNSHQILFISTNLPSFPPPSPSPLTPSRMQQHLIVLYWYTAFHLYGSRIYVFWLYGIFLAGPKGNGLLCNRIFWTYGLRFQIYGLSYEPGGREQMTVWSPTHLLSVQKMISKDSCKTALSVQGCGRLVAASCWDEARPYLKDQMGNSLCDLQHLSIYFWVWNALNCTLGNQFSKWF